MIKVKRNILLSPLSTFRIGGRVKFFCEARNNKELLETFQLAKKLKIPYKIVAGGSNVVFPDKKLNCLLIKVKSQKLKVRGNRIFADAGMPLQRVIAMANKCGLRGLETLAGIPGTLGGAIVGNAGAYGHSISEVVEKVEIFPPLDRLVYPVIKRSLDNWIKISNRECKFGYRESIFKNRPYIILRAVLKFGKSDSRALAKISKEIIQTRLKKYKLGLRCPGSFFKNVLIKDISKKSLAFIDKNKIIESKIPAGYLLESVGAKGMRCGGIRIADFHGNLFINEGSAKASDVKKLAKILKNRVKKKFGIRLEEEIRYF